MTCSTAKRNAGALLLGAWLLLVGCQRQQKNDAGKTYTPENKGASQSGSESSNGQGDAKPLNAPADTTNGKPSRDSDVGASGALRGQVVAEPGAPVAHDAQRKPQQDAQKPPGRH